MLMTDLSSECPSPGVYLDVPFDQYNAWRALSNSGLTLLAKSPRHFHDGDRSEQTADMRIGELCHCGVFEPSALADRYAILPPFECDPGNVTGDGSPSTSNRTNYYRDKKAEFEEKNCGKEIVSRGLYESAMTLVRELALNDAAHRLLNSTGPCEVSIVWDETVPGGWSSPVRCKARIDKISLSEGAIVDLKKCKSVAEFEKDIAYRRYHRQLALYQRGWSALHGGECLTPWLIAHEISVPMAVLAAPLSDVAIMEGEEQVDRLLQLFCECRAADAWPGIENPKSWTLPEWALSPVSLFANGEKVEI